MRSIGGSTPWSKMRICVRSRMPMMWPWTSDLVAGAQLQDLALVGDRERDLVRAIGSELPVEVDVAVGVDVRRRAARGPALVVDGDRVERHVRVRVLDVALEDGHVAAEAHRADPGLVQQLEQLVLELATIGSGLRVPTGRAIASFARYIA